MQRLYVLNSKNLPLPYRAVMAGHAVAEYMLQKGQTNWKNEYLIYLDVDDIQYWKEYLDFTKVENVPFYEPDLNNQLVSIAVLGNGKLFKNLKLMGS